MTMNENVWLAGRRSQRQSQASKERKRMKTELNWNLQLVGCCPGRRV